MAVIGVIDDLLGFSALGIVALMTLCAARYTPSISVVLIIGYVIRFFACLFHYYVAPLPDGASDAISFEKTAWSWGSHGVYEVFSKISDVSDGWIISWLIGLLYALTDRSPLMAQAISLMFGMGSIYIGWLLAARLWGKKIAVKAAWFLALFPTLILYSALIMREAYIWFFVLLAFYGVVRWFKRGGMSSLLVAMGGYFGATLFHGALLVGGGAFIGIIFLNEVKRFFQRLIKGKLRFISVILVALAVFLILFYVFSDVSIPYIGSFDQAVDSDHLLRQAKNTTRGEASYPEWTSPKSPIEILWKAPARMMYFLFSPFPWDISSSAHLFGFFDGWIYFLLTIMLWRNRKRIWLDSGSKAAALIIGAYIIVFAFGVGNFGTAVRHRAKFAAVLIVLAAPMLPRFRLNKSKE